MKDSTQVILGCNKQQLKLTITHTITWLTIKMSWLPHR
ncbi:rCG57955 [Rattus norvegicus]|uniref:RCG57955 n=1 Tax=Rattus norvegicus TaxID=10116 RepID=A6J556_RAT|nr:rCG57955 [Rattus norvegicus]